MLSLQYSVNVCDGSKIDIICLPWTKLSSGRGMLNVVKTEHVASEPLSSHSVELSYSDELLPSCTLCTYIGISLAAHLTG